MSEHAGAGFWWRIPLPSDIDGVTIFTTKRLMSESDWQQFMATLEAMKPGLVIPEEAQP